MKGKSAFVLFLYLINLQGVCWAQSKAEPTLPADAFSQWVQAAESFPSVTFVLEGVPVPQQGEERSPIAFDSRAGLGEFLKETADIFDVSILHGENVITIRRKYSSLKALPSGSAVECVQTIRNLARQLAFSDPQIPPQTSVDYNPAVSDLLQSFTKEQWQRLTRGQKEEGFVTSPIPIADALPVALLGAQQKELALRFALYFYLQDYVKRTAFYANKAKSLLDEGVMFRYSDSKKETFGYEFTLSDHKRRFWPLSDKEPSVQASREDGEPLLVTVGVDKGRNGTISPEAETDAKDNPAGGIADVALIGAMTNVETMTLGNLCSSLSGEKPVRVNEALTERTFMLIRAKSGDRNNILPGVLALYDLKRIPDIQGGSLITSPPPAPPVALAEISERLRRLLPQPIRDAIAGRSQKRLNDLRRALKCRIRSAAEPLASRSASGITPLSDLDGQVRNDLACLYLLDAWNDLRVLTERPAPVWITNFDKAAFTGAVHKSADGLKVALFIAFPDATGKNLLMDATGVSGVRLDHLPE